jgi:hypothetical protein
MNRGVLKAGIPGELNRDKKPGINKMRARCTVYKMMQKMYEPELMIHKTISLYMVCTNVSSMFVNASFSEIATPKWIVTHKGFNPYNPVGLDGMGIRNIYKIRSGEEYERAGETLLIAGMFHSERCKQLILTMHHLDLCVYSDSYGYVVGTVAKGGAWTIGPVS